MRHSQPIPVIRPMSHPSLRLVIERREDDLPPCPTIVGGVAVRYMGTERRRVEGEGTGYVYYADPARRLFEVDRRDLAGILTLRAFVLAD